VHRYKSTHQTQFAFDPPRGVNPPSLNFQSIQDSVIEAAFALQQTHKNADGKNCIVELVAVSAIVLAGLAFPFLPYLVYRICTDQSKGDVDELPGSYELD